jgi:hypothetical protein
MGKAEGWGVGAGFLSLLFFYKDCTHVSASLEVESQGWPSQSGARDRLRRNAPVAVHSQKWCIFWVGLGVRIRCEWPEDRGQTEFI